MILPRFLSVDGRQAVHDGVRRTADKGPTFERIVRNMLRFVNTRPDGEYYARHLHGAIRTS